MGSESLFIPGADVFQKMAKRPGVLVQQFELGACFREMHGEWRLPRASQASPCEEQPPPNRVRRMGTKPCTDSTSPLVGRQPVSDGECTLARSLRRQADHLVEDDRAQGRSRKQVKTQAAA